MKGQENAQRGPGWAAFPHRRSYSRGIGIAWHPSRTLKPDQTPMWPGHQFSINHWQNTILHQFMNLLYVLELMSDLIWSLRGNMFDTSVCWCTCHLGARQLHQFQVHTQRRIWHAAENHVQPVGSWEGNCLEGIILTLLGPTWLCLNSRPRSQEGKPFSIFFGRLLTVAYDVLRLAGTKPYRYHLSSKLFQKSKWTHEFLE